MVIHTGETLDMASELWDWEKYKLVDPRLDCTEIGFLWQCSHEWWVCGGEWGKNGACVCITVISECISVCSECIADISQCSWCLVRVMRCLMGVWLCLIGVSRGFVVWVLQVYSGCRAEFSGCV